MHFWRVRHLSDRFARGEVGRAEILRYVLFFALLWFWAWQTEATDTADRYLTAVELAIQVAGFIACFRATIPSPDRTAFVSKYVALYCPTFIRLMVFTLPAVFAVEVVGFNFVADWHSLSAARFLFSPVHTSVLDGVFVIGVSVTQAIWIWREAKWITAHEVPELGSMSAPMTTGL